VPGEPRFFATAAAFRAWLEKNHERVRELWVGFHKKGSGRPSLTYPEALDEALCFGWIDGVRKSLDQTSYIQRFTPRKAGSYWSAVNTRRAGELKKAGRMAPPGMAAFERRDATRTAKYSFEREAAAFSRADQRTFRAAPGAWPFFRAQAPYYQRVCTHWVVSAKKQETHRRRLEELIAACSAGRRLDLLAPKSRR
jgi:uncharacterized protein YdeI (YjbR/CyaY-like superfamily)